MNLLGSFYRLIEAGELQWDSFRVLCCLSINTPDKDYPLSYRALMSQCSLGLIRVRFVLRELEELGYIRVTSRENCKKGSSNLIVKLLPVSDFSNKSGVSSGKESSVKGVVTSESPCFDLENSLSTGTEGYPILAKSTLSPPRAPPLTIRY